MANIPVKIRFTEAFRAVISGTYRPMSSLQVLKLDSVGNWQKTGDPIMTDDFGTYNANVEFSRLTNGVFKLIDLARNEESREVRVDSAQAKEIIFDNPRYVPGANNLPLDTEQPNNPDTRVEDLSSKIYREQQGPNALVIDPVTGEHVRKSELADPGKWGIGGKPAFDINEYPSAYSLPLPSPIALINSFLNQLQAPPYQQTNPPVSTSDLYNADGTLKTKDQFQQVTALSTKALPIVGQRGEKFRLDPGSIVV